MTIDAILEYVGQNWVGLTALLVSLYVFVADRIKRFNLSIKVAGRFTVTRNPFSPEDPAAVIDLIARNKGARPGVLENIGLIVEGPDGRSPFIAHMLMLSGELSLGENLPPPRFVPFALTEFGKREARLS